MRTYILSRAAFSDAYVERILAATPADWHVVHTRAQTDAASIRPNILFVLGGSAQNQKTQTVRIRFGGGSATGPITVPIQKLEEFLKTL